MSTVLSCVDPWGRWVRLDERIWRTKIAVPGRVPIDRLDKVELAITDPDLVTHDKTHADRECYYKPRVLPAPQDRTFLKVVIEFAQDPESDEDTGFVDTAFPVNRVHRRETPKWP